MSATSPSRPGHANGGRPDPPIQIMLRPLASPLPIGFFAFAVGSFLFSTLELGWIGASQTPELATIMVVFVAPLELIASLLAFWARDAGGATALGLFGMTWATVAAILLTSPMPRSAMLGAFLLAMSAVIATFAAAAIATRPALTVVSAMAAARFIFTGIYELTGGSGWERASGWIGLPLCAGAFYLAVALMVEDAQHRTVLPLLRRGAGRSAIESGLGDQVSAIEREAGVRAQL